MKKRRKKSEQQKKVEELDRLWSLVVRTRDNFQCQGKGCPANGNRMHGAHIWSRGNRSTRWDEDNGITFCFYHHITWAHRQPLEFAEWIKELIGDKMYEELRKKSNEILKVTPQVLEEIKEKLEERLKYYQGLNDEELF